MSENKDNSVNLRGMDFSSLSDSLDKEVSLEEYKERIQDHLSKILNRRFPDDPEKRKIHYHSDRINFSCPYCGDSMQTSHKKRGNIILKHKFANFYKCHNCDAFKRVDHFFKDFNQEIELDVINYISNHVNSLNSSSGASLDAGILLDKDELEKFAITRSFLKNIFSLEEAYESEIYPWLKERLQFKTEYFLYHPYKKYLLILNLTPNNKVLAAQQRNFKRNKNDYRPKYKTYKLSKLYEFITEELNNRNRNASKFDLSKIPQSKIEEIDTYSQIFNILNIDLSKKITLFEGWMDALLYRNSVGNSGLQKHFPLSIPVRYWLDDDNDGKKKTIEYSQKGLEVFLWERFKSENNLPHKNKWDLNEVMRYLHHNNMRVPLFDQYFSDDPLDAIDI